MFRFFKFGVGKNGVVTTRYPSECFVPSDGYLGMPAVVCDKCDLCGECVHACPTEAISITGSNLNLDLGLCIFCGECARSCLPGAMIMTKEYELAGRSRKELVEECDVKR